MTPELILALRALRILVVDDFHENRVLVDIYLRGLLHGLEFAENGLVAVEKFEVGNFDVVLMDIEMPVMDGHSATRAIRKLERSLGRPRTPIIAVSASPSEDMGERSREAGCDLHVTRPLSKSKLLEVLYEHSGC
jgi:two-component system sensor histidine kinase/response regulator